MKEAHVLNAYKIYFLSIQQESHHSNMKFFTFGACAALAAAGTVSVRDGETPHDPEAMAFCQGREDGYYSNPKDCGSYFFCWNNGKYITLHLRSVTYW